MAVSHMCRYILILFLGVICIDLFAQSADVQPDADVKQKIRTIKLDESYLKAEADDATTDQAYKVAVMTLMLDLKSDNENPELDSLLLDMLKPALQTLVYTRGTVKRVFVYVEFEEANNIFHQAEKKLAEKEKPKAPTPIVYHDEQNEPNIIMVTDDDSEEDSDSEESEPEQESQEETPEEPAEEKSSSSQPVVTSTANYNDLILLLNGIEMADEAIKVLQKFKSDGKVDEIGQLKAGMQIPEGAILIIYNRQHQLQALLSQENAAEGTHYYNIKRDCPDSLANYSGCGILWFR